MQFLDHVHGYLAIFRLAAYSPLRVVLDDEPQQSADDFAVIDDQD
jgi:hypothetical protein